MAGGSLIAMDAEQQRAANGQFGSGGGEAGEKTKTSTSALKTKLEGMSHEKLTSSLKNPNVDPAIKKHIEKELDSRADRGTSKGLGEDAEPYVASMSGEAGRQARKLARDCNTGRFRP